MMKKRKTQWGSHTAIRVLVVIIAAFVLQTWFLVQLPKPNNEALSDQLPSIRQRQQQQQQQQQQHIALQAVPATTPAAASAVKALAPRKIEGLKSSGSQLPKTAAISAKPIVQPSSLSATKPITPRVPHPKPKKFSKIATIFSAVRDDRSGAAILNYLMGHAFAFQYGMTYAGVCGTSKEQVKELVDFLGLRKEIPVDNVCPTDMTTQYMLPQFDAVHKQFNGTQILTPEWRRYIQSRLIRTTPALSTTQGSSTSSTLPPLEVAVHVRRGDVIPSYWWKYLPNRHYLNILDTHLPPTDERKQHVTIYSESNYRGDGFQVFLDRNYTLNLDGNLKDVWHSMMESDVLILSKSDFSFVPALLGNARVLYTPFPNAPFPGWETIDESITNRTLQSFPRTKLMGG